MELIKWLNEHIIWGTPMLILFTTVGLYYSIRTGFFQIRKLPLIIKSTIFANNKTSTDKNSLSPFQTLTASLATTLGTGNIVAIGTAVAFGGAGAVFWMWVSAIIGMITCYAENLLGMKYRKKMPDKSYGDVPFAYIRKAFGKKFGGVMASAFALFCVLASFGMGNMVQINAASNALNECFSTPTWVVGLVSAIIILFVIIGGIKRFGNLTEKLIPFLSLVYIVGCFAVIIVNFKQIPACFTSIFTEAFSLKSAGFGIMGSVMINAMQWGVKRGIFSNEAGLGSSVMIHSYTTATNPKTQGMWAMLQVFIDTIIICTLTALVILLTGANFASTDGNNMAYIAFSTAFGNYAGMFVSVSIYFFAISTIGGWWVFGKTSIQYLFKSKGVIVYFIIFIALVFIGAIMNLEMVWEISDLFNGLMAIPNLLALLFLSKEIIKLHKSN